MSRDPKNKFQELWLEVAPVLDEFDHVQCEAMRMAIERTLLRGNDVKISDVMRTFNKLMED